MHGDERTRSRFPDWLPLARSRSPRAVAPWAMRPRGNIIGLLKRGAPPRIARSLDGLPEILGRVGTLEVRLALTKKDIKRAQKLRYKVFYEEMSATPNPAAYLSRRDKDPFDYVCDHLLVLDHDAPVKPFQKPKPRVVGTYRLLRQEVAERHFGFYSAHEYEVDSLIRDNPDKRFLELGRSCVLKEYRAKRTVDLLWQGIYTYMAHHRIDVMVGCASLEGTDPTALALPLSFLHHYAGGADGFRPRAVPARYVAMDMIDKAGIDPKQALRQMPPLIKGYLRLGATVGDGAVIDRQFGTTDVLVVLRVSEIDRRYMSHYLAGATRLVA